MDAIKLRKEDSMESPIQKLDEYSLSHIFRYLPIADLVRIERTCKSWQEIAKRSWANLKTLTVNPRKFGLRIFGNEHRYPGINEYVVEEVLKRCGKYLKEFNAQGINFDFTSLVSKYCKNIESISCEETSLQGIEELSKMCNNIYEFSTYYFTNYIDEELEARLDAI